MSLWYDWPGMRGSYLGIVPRGSEGSVNPDLMEWIVIQATVGPVVCTEV